MAIKKTTNHLGKGGAQIPRPHFGIKDLTSDDPYGRTLPNYAAKSPMQIAAVKPPSMFTRKK